jgi:SAM-dependent methyltransferase
MTHQTHALMERRTRAYCYNCGGRSPYRRIHPIDDALQRTWGISDRLARQFNRREGSICPDCGVNLRAQGLARAILKSKYGFGKASLKEWVQAANVEGLQVCELNSCHELHQTLTKLRKLTYAEYGTDSQQNIEGMTYPSDTFDLFLHSETVEHVNNPALAADECRRVIKPHGLVLFTTPVIWNRTTRRRARRDGERIHHILERSYHEQPSDDYLVFFEYGRDIDRLLGVSLSLADWRNQNYVFSSGKVRSTIKPATKVKLGVLEKIAEIGTSERLNRMSRTLRHGGDA